MAVDGFAKLQALNFGISGPEIPKWDSPSNQQNKGFYCKIQALKSKFQGPKFGDSIHRHSIPHLLPPDFHAQTQIPKNYNAFRLVSVH